MLISEKLVALYREFQAAGIENPQADAELIVAHVLGVTRGRVQSLAILDRTLTTKHRERVDQMAQDRASRVPLQHLTGRAPFRRIELSVGPGVFIPRAETEVVTQLAVDELLADFTPEPIAIDLCTGSGAIALALAQEVDRVQVLALEKSEEAYAWAQLNVAEFGDDRVTLLHGDIAEPQTEFASVTGRVSVVISNPPYVPQAAIPRDPEVHEHDPELALYSGTDGLDLIRVISRVAKPLLRPGGLLVLEHAESQGAAVRALLSADGWAAVATHRDLTLRDRATTARA